MDGVRFIKLYVKDTPPRGIAYILLSAEQDTKISGTPAWRILQFNDVKIMYTHGNKPAARATETGAKPSPVTGKSWDDLLIT